LDDRQDEGTKCQTPQMVTEGNPYAFEEVSSVGLSGALIEIPDAD